MYVQYFRHVCAIGHFYTFTLEWRERGGCLQALFHFFVTKKPGALDFVSTEAGNAIANLSR